MVPSSFQKPEVKTAKYAAREMDCVFDLDIQLTVGCGSTRARGGHFTVRTARIKNEPISNDGPIFGQSGHCSYPPISIPAPIASPQCSHDEFA